jgi:hypothetical protein
VENQQSGLKGAAANRLEGRNMNWFKQLPKWGRLLIGIGVPLAICLMLVLVLPTVGHPGNPNPTGNSSDTNIVYEGNQTIPTLETGFGVYGSQVTFDGVYPGWSGTVPLIIVNGQDRDRFFVLSVVSPSSPKTGYEPFPEQYLYWLTISEPSFEVAKGENHQVPITVTIPMDSGYKGKRAEVRIRIEDTTQTGIVQIALESRWFIITAD